MEDLGPNESSSRRLKIKFKTMNIANMAPFHSLAMFVSLNQIFNVVAVQCCQLFLAKGIKVDDKSEIISYLNNDQFEKV